MERLVRFVFWVFLLSVLVLNRLPARAETGVQKDAAVELPPIVVTPTLTEESILEVSYAVEVLNAKKIIQEDQSRTLPEALKELPGVMVQKTAQGQGSPYIRGFTGFRTLLLIDGIRLNNSTFRDGPNQYWNTIDPFTINRLELVKGPSSVLYGSDSVGGTLNVITKAPFFGEKRYGADAVYRYATADESNVGRLEGFAAATGNLALMGGVSYKDFGDVRAAGIGIQPHTGYDEMDYDLKAVYRFDDKRSIVLARQDVSQDEIWRTHKTIYAISWEGTAVGTDKKYATDQYRRLTYLQYHDKSKWGIFDTATLSLSYHEQQEDRDRIKSDSKEDREGFEADTLGLFGQFTTRLPGKLGLLAYGFEYYRDSVDSYARHYSSTGVLTGTEIQGPVADDSRYDLGGIYAQDEILLGERASILAGGRYTYAKAVAGKIKDPVSGNQFSMSKSWDNVVGNIRGQYFVVPQRWNVYAGVSQAFRAPNLSDLTSFEDALQNSKETPSTDLEPEKYVNYEVGIKGDTGRFTAQLDYFYTRMTDYIVRYPTGATISGKSELKKANASKGYIDGVEVALGYRVIPEVLVYGNFTWLEGKIDQPQIEGGRLVFKEDNISKLQPLTTILGARYDHSSGLFWLEALVNLVGKQNKLAYTDLSDTGRIPPGGNPGYTLTTVRGGVKLGKHLRAALAFENVFNEEYRVLGSGQNEPGRNLILTITGLI